MPMTGRRRLLLLAALLVAVAGGAYAVTRGPAGSAAAATTPGGEAPSARFDDSVRAPDGVRIRVEVLNASRVRGLARRATMELRDRGFDVVAIGNASEQRDSTIVLSRAGDEEWAHLVARAVGGATVEVRPDSSRYVEVSLLLGSTWRPPPGPFRP